jgi:hypothetical protein
MVAGVSSKKMIAALQVEMDSMNLARSRTLGAKIAKEKRPKKVAGKTDQSRSGVRCH